MTDKSFIRIRNNNGGEFKMADYNEMTIKEMYDLTQTIAAELFEGKTYPWEVLPEIGDFIVKLGATLDPNEYEKKGENVWIAKSAKVAPTASITGPCIIGKDTEVRQCAFIRGKAIRKGNDLITFAHQPETVSIDGKPVPDFSGGCGLLFRETCKLDFCQPGGIGKVTMPDMHHFHFNQ